MRAFPIIVLSLAACGLAEPTPVAVTADVGVVDEALVAARPEPLVELVEDTRLVVPSDAFCPVVTVLDADLDSSHELWVGGCSLSDGTRIDGRLEVADGLAGRWVAGDRFKVSRDGVLELYVDGSVELIDQGELWLVDAAATLCAGEVDCADGPVTMSLAFSLYPTSAYPERYDATVSGAVGGDESLISVEGAWSVDASACLGEPASGMLALRGAERHLLELDGASACDDCAAWTVQGLAAPAYCGLGL